MVEIINPLEDLCRLCAGKVDLIMGLNIFESDHRQIFKKICVCLPIQVSADDGFPKMVCVECACKLDLMFDFRERSILTAHLFSDMITVNSGNVLNVEQNIVIGTENESIEEHGFSNDQFVSQCDINCKMGSEKFSEEIMSNCTETENILNSNQEETLDKEILSRAKSKPKTLRTSKRKELSCSQNEKTNKVMTDVCFAEKKLSFNCNAMEQGEYLGENELGNCLTTKDILQDEKVKVESMLTANATPNIECSNLEWFLCNNCNKTFSDKETYDEHSRENCYTCKCGIACGNEEALKLHMTQNHPTHCKKTRQKKIGKMKAGEKAGSKKNECKVCTECGKQYQTNYKLQEHMRKHTGEKPYSCSYQDCKKAFRSKIGLAQHEANHSGQYEFSCSTCGKGFQCKSYLVVHQRVHSDLKPFICKQCSRKFKTKQSLLDHMNRHLGVKPYICDVCGRGFITKGLCKSHQKVHSGTDNRQYPCHVCRKLFVSKSYLNTHFRIHTGDKPFMCEVCGKGFLTRVDLRIHSTMHTGEKSFVCEMCGKAFARRDALRCHRRSHTGERPYKCEFCGQSFTQFSPMAIHKRLHTGERPYQCDVCSKTFVSRSTMIAHRKKHHSAKVEGAQFQFVEVEVQRELDGHEKKSAEQLVVIEESPQLLLALSKRRTPIAEPSDRITSLHKVKNEGSEVPAD